MFRKATHIILSLLLISTTAGFALSKQSCQPVSFSISSMAVSADHCEMPAEDCHAQITSIKLKSSFVGITHTISVAQVTEDTPSSVSLVQMDASDEESAYTFSTFKLPKIQTVLARLQSYLL
ncbi:MAG: hypothetical protein KGY70_02715 [Bacteroidales bacterium]|nr:hypothetical protein [Bacteroidales bacterium]